ncbi:MAG TPA: cytochrome P450 [Pyrinomonadaceae bacterium]|jgi:cytochrome P450 PksS
MVQVKVTDFAQPEFKANPYPFYARLRAEAPVVQTKLFRQPTWLVTRYDNVFMVLKDQRLLKDWLPRTKWLHRLSGPTFGHMLNQDGPDHARLRTLVHKAFTPEMSGRMRDQIQRICDELLDEVATSSRMELMNGYALPLPLAIISQLLGIPAEDRRRLHALTRSSLSASNILGVLRAMPDQRLLIRRLRQLIAERRHEPREDLITALVQAEEAGDRLSEKELVATIMLLLIAGYETTVNLIGNGALALLQHPEQRHLFEQNPALVESAIEEMLRYTSPLDIASQRFAREDMKINSASIRQGDVVIAVIGSANHDESQFPDPEKFDITREPNKHLSFGQGVHFCIGAPLARLEGQIALTTLFRRFPNLRLAQEPDSLRWRRSLIVRGLEELPVAA